VGTGDSKHVLYDKSCKFMSPKAKERQLVMNFRTNHLSLLGVICMSVSTEINATITNNLFEFSDLPYFDSLKNNFHVLTKLPVVQQW